MTPTPPLHDVIYEWPFRLYRLFGMNRLPPNHINSMLHLVFNVFLVIFSGLKNDSLKETFTLKHELEGQKFPCKYIKIGKEVICV